MSNPIWMAIDSKIREVSYLERYIKRLERTLADARGELCTYKNELRTLEQKEVWLRKAREEAADAQALSRAHEQARQGGRYDKALGILYALGVEIRHQEALDQARAEAEQEADQ